MVNILDLYISWCRLEWGHKWQRRRQRQTDRIPELPTNISKNCQKRVYIYIYMIHFGLGPFFRKSQTKKIYIGLLKVNQNLLPIGNNIYKRQLENFSYRDPTPWKWNTAKLGSRVLGGRPKRLELGLPSKGPVRVK